MGTGTDDMERNATTPASGHGKVRRTRTRLAAGLLGALAPVLVVAAAPGDAEANELTLTVNAGQQYNYADSYDVLSDDDQAPYTALGLAFEVFENLHIGAEYEVGGEIDPLFGNDVEYLVQGAVLSVQYGFPVTSWFEPHVRVGAGAYFGDLRIIAADETYSGNDVGFGFYAVGGFDLLWRIGDPSKPGFWNRLTLGLATDWGWAHRPSFDFDEVLPAQDGSVVPLDMGEVAQQGWTWRVGLQLRYEL